MLLALLLLLVCCCCRCHRCCCCCCCCCWRCCCCWSFCESLDNSLVQAIKQALSISPLSLSLFPSLSIYLSLSFSRCIYLSISISPLSSCMRHTLMEFSHIRLHASHSHVIFLSFLRLFVRAWTIHLSRQEGSNACSFWRSKIKYTNQPTNISQFCANCFTF